MLKVLFRDSDATPKLQRITSTEDWKHTIPSSITPSIANGKLMIRDSLCHGKVSATHIALTRNKSIMLVLFREAAAAAGPLKDQLADESIVPLAFLTALTIPQGHYIDTVCAKPGYGNILLEYFIDYSEATGADEIILHALPTVLSYYPKFDFSHRSSCDVPPSVFMPASLRSQKFESYRDMLANPDAFHYFNALKDNGFAIEKTKKCAPGTPVSAAEFGKNQCAEKGFLMARCAREAKPAAARKAERQERQLRAEAAAAKKSSGWLSYFPKIW
jgi:hypothetical protein